jgi:SAM-dependent methyltransferase
MTMETERQYSCPLCAAPGELIYDDLRDSLFGAPGVWGTRACPACGAWWLDPRPTPASIGEAYRTYYTHGRRSGVAALYDAAIRRLALERAAAVYGFGRPTPGLGQLCALATRLHPGLIDQADLLIRHLPASAMGEDGRLLDVGCGHGEALGFLARLGWQATGVEIDPLAVEAARAGGLDVIQGEIGSAGLADDSFDAVTSSHVIEHVHDPRRFLAESRRVLREGGVLVAVTPNSRSELSVRHARNWLGLDPPRHLVLFNADNLARLASEVGFGEVSVNRTARLASFAHIASVGIAAEGPYQLGTQLGWRLWLEAKLLEAQMIRDLRHGRAEGEELVLIARK